VLCGSVFTFTDFFLHSVTRREYLINRVVQFLSAWSLRHPRFFRYAVLLSSGEVVLCADPVGLCSGPSNLGIIFVLSIYHFERSCPAFVVSFSSPLDTLAEVAVSSPFGHRSSLSVSPSMDTPPSHLQALSSSDRSQTVSPIRLVSLSPVTPARPDVSYSPYSSIVFFRQPH
jgi:hypothetical protein